MPDFEVTDDPVGERYEIRADGDLAGYLEYRGGGEVRAFTHTQIHDGFAGQGVGGRLVAAALDAERAAGRYVLPLCSYVRHFLAEHPEYVDVVSPPHRRDFA